MLNYLLVVIAAAAYWAWGTRAQWWSYLFPERATAPAADEESLKQERWINTLLRLQRELEDEGEAETAALARELVWRMLGGEPHKR